MNRKKTAFLAIVGILMCLAVLAYGCSVRENGFADRSSAGNLNEETTDASAVSAEDLKNNISDTEIDASTESGKAGDEIETGSIEYVNDQYGFSIKLPESWKGFIIAAEEWEGLPVAEDAWNKETETGPVIKIRHPLWTEQNVRQDIPIMVLTLEQWDLMQRGEFHIGAAPINPTELGRNSKYVFALPARYNFEFPTGYEEVEKILEGSPLKPLEPIENANPGTAETKSAAPASPKLGGISLGDSPETVLKILGKEFTEYTELDESGYFGEDMEVWTYDSGIVVYFGKTTGKVVRIESTGPDFQTDLGIKAGDTAKKVFETYKPLYKEAESRHGGGVLEGWYLTDDEIVIIFDFDKSDGTLLNYNVTPDSRVEEIIMDYWKHFD